MSDEENAFRYDKMVENALRGVVKTALEEVIEKGLYDEHHFYITFRTDFPGVEIPDYLRERYPGEMTIVLQHQFYDLEVDQKRFTVMLKFNNIPERLVIPLPAITIFTDPSVNFALQFQPLSEENDANRYGDEVSEFDEDETSSAGKVKGKEAKGEVVSLDQFRSTGKNEKPVKKPVKSAKDEKSDKSKKDDKDTKDSDKKSDD